MAPCLGDHLCSGTQCGDYAHPRRPFPCVVRQLKVLDIAIDKVSGALSMHAVPPTIRIVCGTHKSDSPIRAL
jgi:hypothetical protein